MNLSKAMKKWMVVGGIMTAAAMLFAGCQNTEHKGINVDTKDYVTLGEYKNLEVNVAVGQITDEIVQEGLENALYNYGEPTKVTDRDYVKDGDIVNLDFVGTKDGVAFEGGTATDYLLMIGSNSTVPGFEDGIIGHKLNETFVVPVTFPNDYGEPTLAGQDVEFEMTIKGILESKLPELTDDFVKQLNMGYETAAELREYMRSYLEEKREREVRLSVWNAVIDNCTVSSTPQEMDDENYQMLMEQVEYYANNDYKLSLEEYIKQTGYTLDEFEQETKSKAKILTEETLICYAIADQEGFSVTKDEIDAYAEENAKEYGLEDGKAFLEEYGEDAVERYLLTDKVQLFLVENAVIIEPEN